jgi:hypothetical protein
MNFSSWYSKLGGRSFTMLSQTNNVIFKNGYVFSIAASGRQANLTNIRFTNRHNCGTW